VATDRPPLGRRRWGRVSISSLARSPSPRAVSRRRKRERHLRRVRVDVDRSPVQIAVETARQFDPTLTDAEIAQGLRELADQIEREAALEEAS
jgi:hypothetical protein